MKFFIKSNNNFFLNSLLEISLVLLILISGIYAVPYFPISGNKIVEFKRYYFLIVALILLFLFKYTHPLSLEKKFYFYCISLIAIFSINIIFRIETSQEYFYYIFSIFFILLLVNCISNINFNFDRFLLSLRIGINFFYIFIFSILILIILGDSYIYKLLISGFGGNRVNFSIWLWQIIYLNFFLVDEDNRNTCLLAFIFSLILLFIQVLTGGRIGILASILTIIFFSWRYSTNLLMRLFSLVLIGLVVNQASIYVEVLLRTNPEIIDNVSIFREINTYEDSTNFINYLDKVSSHRISILFNSFNYFDWIDLVIGKGAGNSDVTIESKSWLIHNVFVKAFVEFGILVPAIYLLIILIPFQIKFKDFRIRNKLLLIIILSVMVCMVQPYYFFSGLSNCLLTWICFGIALREYKLDQKLKNN